MELVNHSDQSSGSEVARLDLLRAALARNDMSKPDQAPNV